jgi:hypothetical protein
MFGARGNQGSRPKCPLPENLNWWFRPVAAVGSSPKRPFNDAPIQRRLLGTDRCNRLFGSLATLLSYRYASRTLARLDGLDEQGRRIAPRAGRRPIAEVNKWCQHLDQISTYASLKKENHWSTWRARS